MEELTNEIGTLYCFSNELYKDNLYNIGSNIGTDERELYNQLEQLNNEWVPSPFKLEFAKQNVKNYKEKENQIHKVLDKYRTNPKKDFFKCSLETIRGLFNLIEGEWVDGELFDLVLKSGEERRRLYGISNGDIIRHTIDGNTWDGIYNSIKRCIIYCGKHYKLNKFVDEHYKSLGQQNTCLNEYKECYIKFEGEWETMYIE